MEVFLAFRDLNDVPLLEKTMEAWDQAGAEPIGIQVKKRAQYELFRRITAESQAANDVYILADLGCVLADDSDFAKLAMAETEGLKGLTGSYRSDIPTGVRLVRRGVVRKWVQQMDDIEHARLVRMFGKEVSVFPDIFYKRLQAHC